MCFGSSNLFIKCGHKKTIITKDCELFTDLQSQESDTGIKLDQLGCPNASWIHQPAKIAGFCPSCKAVEDKKTEAAAKIEEARTRAAEAAKQQEEDGYSHIGSDEDWSVIGDEEKEGNFERSQILM